MQMCFPDKCRLCRDAFPTPSQQAAGLTPGQTGLLPKFHRLTHRRFLLLNLQLRLLLLSLSSCPMRDKVQEIMMHFWIVSSMRLVRRLKICLRFLLQQSLMKLAMAPPLRKLQLRLRKRQSTRCA